MPDLFTKVKLVYHGAVLSRATLVHPVIFPSNPPPVKAYYIFYPFKSKTYLELPQDWEIKLSKSQSLPSSKVQKVK